MCQVYLNNQIKLFPVQQPEVHCIRKCQNFGTGAMVHNLQMEIGIL